MNKMAFSPYIFVGILAREGIINGCYFSIEVIEYICCNSKKNAMMYITAK